MQSVKFHSLYIKVHVTFLQLIDDHLTNRIGQAIWVYKLYRNAGIVSFSSIQRYFFHIKNITESFIFDCSHIDTNFVNLFLSNPFLIFLVCRFILVIVSLILTVLSTVQTEEKNFQDILHVPVLVVVSS